MLLSHLINSFLQKYFSFNRNFNLNSSFIEDNLKNDEVHFFYKINKIELS